MRKSIYLALSLTIVVVIVGCCVGPFAPAPTPTPNPTRTLRPTYTAIPTSTPTPVATDTPTPTNTPTPTDTPLPTATRQPATPTATTPPPPTSTPKPSNCGTCEFLYEQGSMQTAQNCGTVYLRVKVLGQGGTPANGIAVRLTFYGIVVNKITGYGNPGDAIGGEPAGEAGFSPLEPAAYHAPFDFTLQLVQSPENPSPRSDPVVVHFTDCATAGQFTNILFIYQH